MKTIGLIGVGAMGEPMGRALLRAGFAVNTCAHRNRERVERLVAAGAKELADSAAVGAASDAVIAMVPDAPQVEEALFGPRGAALGLTAGKTVIDMSTISPVRSREFHARLAERGIAMLDAPVSGGPARAATAELAIMAGGEIETYAACEPVLRAVGTPTHVGPAGMGETFKLVNQIIIAGVMVADVEALVFAKRAGADLELVRRVIAGATGANYLLENWLPKSWLAGSFEGGFAIDLLRKDLRAALDAATSMNVDMPQLSFNYQAYTDAAALDGRHDYSAVAKLYET